MPLVTYHSSRQSGRHVINRLGVAVGEVLHWVGHVLELHRSVAQHVVTEDLHTLDLRSSGRLVLMEEVSAK